MTNKKRTTSSKRTKPPRNFVYMNKFLSDWERLSESGRHDMNRLKEAMMLLISDDAPLSQEWKDHELNGKFTGMRECHVKGDLLLVYQIDKSSKRDIVMFYRTGTHSEIFG